MKLKNQLLQAPKPGMPMGEAEARAEQAKTRTQQDLTRTQQAETRAEQGATRTEQNVTRARQAETRTEQAATRARQAGTRMEQGATGTEQDTTRARQAETRTEQATVQAEQDMTRTQQAETRLEQAIRASELSYRRLFETAKDGILILDAATGRISDANPFLVELLGFSHDEMIGKTVGELSPFKDIESNQLMLERLQKDGYVRYEDLPLERRDGRKAAVEFVSNVYQAGDKRVIQCNIRDITERKLAEKMVRQLAALVESSDDAIIGKGLDGNILSWNAGAEKMFGYSAAEMVGGSLMSLVPAERLEEEHFILERIERGESVPHLETVRVRKDGSRVDLSLTVSPIKDSAGKVVGASKVARDITERKRADLALRESDERFRMMADSIPQLAWIARTDGYIFWYNQRWYEYTGTTPEQMEGWGWQSVHDPETLPKVMARWTDAINTGKPFVMQFPLRGADGQFRSFLTRVQPLKNSAGQVSQWFGTNTDVDELKQAEENVRLLNAALEHRVQERTAQLLAANEELEAFSYSVSHDLRAPLRAVDGFSQVVLEDYGPQLPEACRQDLQTIRNGAQKMGRLIDDLLMFSRLSRLPLRKQTVDTGKLVRGALEELNPLREGRQIEFQIADLPPCQADPALLKQVWVNLLSNALKYTGKREAALVEVGCAMEKGRNAYFVRDNGAGFDMKYANKLFGVFQRLHRAEDYEGTGVGLAIVQRIIHRHGGRVWAESAVNSGATFYFTLEGETKL